MYINISTCNNDLRDSVHLATVIARMMVLVICACSPLQITRYESVILFESNIVNFMLLSHWGKMMTKLTNQVHCTWWHFSVACIWLILVGIFVSPWLDKQPKINCITVFIYLGSLQVSKAWFGCISQLVRRTVYRGPGHICVSIPLQVVV